MLPKHNAFSSIHFFMGLLCSLGLMFIAFEWRSFEIPEQKVHSGHEVDHITEVALPVTMRKKSQPSIHFPKPVIHERFVVKELFEEIDPDNEFPDEPSIDETDGVEFPQDFPGETEESAEDMPVFIAENMPEFPGGRKALFQYLSKHIRYPALAQEYGVDGTVLLKFVVWKDGSVRNVEVVRSVHPDLDAEAVRVVKQMPRWKPGSQQGQNVAVYFHLPVKFVMQ